MLPSAPNEYTVAVRTLCEFAAKAGDLDLRFTPSPTAQEGIAGHRTVAARRSGSYRSEVAVVGRHRHLIVRGRADGFDVDRALVEEVKTFRGDLDRMPANHRALHRAQARVYAALLCEQWSLDGMTVALVYFDVDREVEAEPIVEHLTAADLRREFERLCEAFIAWADRELAHRAARDAALSALAFPHPAFRPGQRALATAVFNAARSGRPLLAQAPTGIGKTLGTLFPMLKAMPRERLDKVFFLTAKGPGRQLALDAIDTLAPRPPLRTVELIARDKACEHPDRACHGESCPLARGFYDRLPAARLAATAGEAPSTREAIRAVALAHDVCPYYLSQELARWADVVVADYHYWFDGSALLFALTTMNEWRAVALVDEAHNLVERGRDMYGVALASRVVDAARILAPESLRPALDRVRRAWKRVVQTQEQVYEVRTDPPKGLVSALEDATAAIGGWMAEGASAPGPELERFHFDALRFVRLAETFGAHSMFDVTLETELGTRDKRHPPSTLCIRNVVPAPFLAPRFEALRTAVLFSATLTPTTYYVDLLGLPDETVAIDVEAPFTTDQLAVRVVRNLSTRYAHRTRSLPAIVRLMAETYAARPGNYLAFFSSHDYLRQAADAFAAAHPDVPTWDQSRGMSEDARRDWLARFDANGRGIGFAVLGGAFAEGIDLVGDRLVGAFVATLGLPQFNPVNEEMRARLDERFGTGYDYAYLFPGLRKVVQAAGRVIRTPEDRGTVHLIDDRYARPEVRALLPAWWRVESVTTS